ncbi:hypothetical protein PLESTB_000333900 [Pleodorina starrii]|uniref:Uncharacterized protein n=1 Tax=Pleodorina starrii TaxID=330485 RepID=A0A9W6BD94_9CHLO|nr:hypothetical protein PLESTB_000333900 [Pleodorina starrii]
MRTARTTSRAGPMISMNGGVGLAQPTPAGCVRDIHVAPVAAASVAAFKPGAAPAPSAVAAAGGGVNTVAGFGAGLLGPFLAMPDTADERTLQLLDEEDEDGEGEGEG